MVLKGYLFSILYGFLCIIASGLAHKLGLKTIYTRKIAHILIGFEWVILNYYFGASIHFLAVCLIFTAIILIFHITKLFPGLLSDEENSPGTIYYCIAMTLMSGLTLILDDLMLPFGIGVLCTSVGDGFAGVFGRIKKGNPRLYREKTLFGSLTCLVFCLASILIFSSVYHIEASPLFLLIIAAFVTELELFSKNGIDNISVTVGASFIAFLLLNFPTFILYYILPIILTLPIVVFVYEKKVLTFPGIIAALFLDAVVSVSFGNIGFLILISFFGLSLVSDKLKIGTEKRREQRSATQVLANGGLGILFAVLNTIYPSVIWWVAFAAVFAEALADTSSSGIGSRAKQTFDIFRLRRVSSGESGGMSVLGTLSALASSAIISVVSALHYEIGFAELLVIMFSGFAGSVFDSLLGSLAQAKYKCHICGKLTESKDHCNENAEKIFGISWMSNSMVNFSSTLFSSLIAILIIQIIG